MKILLLTGFEPFLKYTVNPTMRIAEELHGKVIGDYKIHSEILTVDFKSSGDQLSTGCSRILGPCRWTLQNDARTNRD